MTAPAEKLINRATATKRQDLDFVRRLVPELCVYTDRGIVTVASMNGGDVPLCDPNSKPVVVLHTRYSDMLKHATWYECYRSNGRGYTYTWDNVGRVAHQQLMLVSDGGEHAFIMYNLMSGPALPLGRLDPSDHFTGLVLAKMGQQHVGA